MHRAHTTHGEQKRETKLWVEEWGAGQTIGSFLALLAENAEVNTKL